MATEADVPLSRYHVVIACKLRQQQKQPQPPEYRHEPTMIVCFYSNCTFHSRPQNQAMHRNFKGIYKNLNKL
jgi:hypothetical protein